MKSPGTYKTLIGLCNKITHLNGIITPEAVNKLEDKLSGVYTIIKTHQYMEGQKYGHLASIILHQKYWTVIADNTWTHATPVNPGAYSAAAVSVGNAAAQRKQLIAKHKVLQSSYANYCSPGKAPLSLTPS